MRSSDQVNGMRSVDDGEGDDEDVQTMMVAMKKTKTMQAVIIGKKSQNTIEQLSNEGNSDISSAGFKARQQLRQKNTLR
eukprot:763923-Hanusia_phi.AAC.3